MPALNKPVLRSSLLLYALLVVNTILPASVIIAQEKETDPKRLAFFEERIRPMLIKHCYECHSTGSEDLGGNLLVDSRANLLAGGDLGPAIVPGKPDESILLSALKYDDLEMPPDGKLPEGVIRDFKKWIQDGAIDPRQGKRTETASTIDLEEGRRHWSFQPLLNQATRLSKTNADKKRSPIDSIVAEQLSANQLDFSPEASPLELLERIHFDLTGLPPELEIQQEFESGKISYEEVVDQLLDSRRFAERFGRHWLDVARYADSSGGGRVLLFPDAWRYRDYVIESFHNDKPFDQFVKEQIAGDLLDAQETSQRKQQLTATGFLMLGAHNYELQDKDLLRMEVVDEQINVIGKSLLGMTLSCARCHDHKFDPIPTRDYYALAGIFRSTKSLLPGNVSKFVTTALPLEPEQRKQLAEFQKTRAEIEKQIRNLQQEIARLDPQTPFQAKDLKSFAGLIVDEEQAIRQGNWTKSTSVKPFVGKSYHHSSEPKASMRFVFKIESSGKYLVRAAYTPGSNRTDSAKYELIHGKTKQNFVVNQKQNPKLQKHFAKLTEIEAQMGDELEVVLRPGKNGTTIADAVHLQPVPTQSKDPRNSEEIARLEKLKGELTKKQEKLKSFAKPPFEKVLVMSVTEEGKTADTEVRIRGDVHSLGPMVPRGALSVVGKNESFGNLEGSGRLELANWIADKRNPLTARVYTNRLWLWLFGKGIVATPDNFGRSGQTPQNQLLLDYLAARFVDNNWSTKQLVREIVLSKTYRQRFDLKRSQTDPENRLLGYHSRQRLDAESIRDRILFFSGKLDSAAGGPAIRPGTRREFGYDYSSPRRSLYLPVFRNTLNEIFEVFDFPNPNLVSGQRNSSILPTQALYLMNSPFVAQHSRLAASEIVERPAGSFNEQLDFAYRTAVARPPSDSEREVAYRYFGLATDRSSENDLPPIPDANRWRGFCQLLISSLDFRYLK